MAPLYPNPAPSAAEREPLLPDLRMVPIDDSDERGDSYMDMSLLVPCLLFFSLLFYGFFADWDIGQELSEPLPTYNVAIVGAGPAGISAAQHLRNSRAARTSVHFNITIYESKPVLGGALALHHANGSSVFPKDDPNQSPITAEDIAGTALMWNNALFTQDSEKALKDKIKFTELGPERIGYYQNALKTASASRPYRKTPTKTWAQLLWTYGNSVWRGDKLAQDGALRKAMLSAPLVPDVERIFKSLGVLNPLKQPAKDMLRDRRVSERYAADFLEPQVQRAYGQGLNEVTGLAAMMAAAQEESANAYGGGNLLQQLRRVVHSIGVDVRTARRVTDIKYVEIGERPRAWLVRHESADSGGGNSSIELFDKVIMAALDLDIQLQDSEEPPLDLRTYYSVDASATKAAVREGDPVVPVHITFFTSDAKLSPWDDEQVLFLEPQELAGMRELTLVREIINSRDSSADVEYLYRVLSQRPILDELQSRTNITWSYQTKIEKAYPILSPLQHFPSFEIPWARGFWWTSGIQRAGTSVDLNWLAGKVAAEALISEVTQNGKTYVPEILCQEIFEGEGCYS
ncbi:hypothetical protein F4824DRAFT_132246 [Ustulina deusta]|nr:hypothetical protein F4824DRAFT_132246 [Ustulina deusta]